MPIPITNHSHSYPRENTMTFIKMPPYPFYSLLFIHPQTLYVSFVCIQISYKWNHTTCILFCFFAFFLAIIVFIKFINAAHSFSILRSIPLNEDTIIYLSVLLLCNWSFVIHFLEGYSSAMLCSFSSSITLYSWWSTTFPIILTPHAVFKKFY